MDSSPSSDFTPPQPEEIAKLLPAFEIISLIAKGGMGAVYLARQKSLDREVAIKILPHHFGEDANFRTSFETEAKSMAKLNHPNLIGIYDFGQVDGLLYIVMEMVHGQSLYHASYGKKVDPEEAGRIICEICHGLDNAHQHGILHRDIKPANILLTANLSPKISDFGLARPVGDHEADSAFGTPGYTAPEVVHNPSAVDESTDLYSVGVMLYELLTSQLPGKPYMPAANLVECDPKFDDIVRKAMNPDPILRYRTAKSMAEAIDAIISGDKGSKTSNPLITASTPSQNKAPTPRPAAAPVVNTKSGKSAARNVVVIIVLLAAIYGAWEVYQNKKATRDAENAEIIKQNEQRKEETKALLREKRDAIQQSSKPNQTDPSRITDAKSTPLIPEPKPRPKPKPIEFASCPELETIRDKCVGLTKGIKKEYDQKFKDNIKSYEHQLDFYLMGLPRNQREQLTPSIEKMQRLVQNDRIPDNFKRQGMPDKVLRTYESRLRIQDNIEKDYFKETSKLRDHYLNNLEKIKQELTVKGLGNQSRIVEQEMRAASSGGQDFVDYMLGGH